ncbi:MAG: hypothetical protein ACLFUS_13950 [Candidatus Sumerlaeia bacterium]
MADTNKNPDPDEFARELRHRADRLCSMILHMDLEWVDVEIQIEQLREFVRSRAPEKLDAFDHIYVSRFERLWEQWKNDRRPVDNWQDDDWDLL